VTAGRPSALARIAELSAAFVCSNLARAAIGFALTLVLGRGLGAARFGGWILCTTWAATLTFIADLGFGVLLTRDGARPDAQPALLLAASLALRLALAMPLALVLVAAAPGLASDAELVRGLRAASLLGVAGAMYGCFGALLRSQPRWLPRVLGLETAWLAVQVAASWWTLQAGGGIVRLLAVAVAVQVAQIATAFALWRPVFGAGSAAPREVRAALAPTLRRALPFAASGIVANLQLRIAPLMLGYLAAPVELGWFAAASRVGRVARLAPQAIFAGALPVLAQEYARDRSEARRVSRTLDRALAAAAACAVAASLLFAAPLMRLIFGASFAPAAPTLMWVAIGLVPSLSNSARKIFLYAAGAESVVVRWSALAVVLEASVGVALIPALGSVGAAISIALAEAVIVMPLRKESGSPVENPELAIVS
jgi:O-antigen/teichoic acid export membrane protein